MVEVILGFLIGTAWAQEAPKRDMPPRQYYEAKAPGWLDYNCAKVGGVITLYPSDNRCKVASREYDESIKNQCITFNFKCEDCVCVK